MPKIVDHEQRRAELLAGSFKLFAEKGYGSVTMRELAKSLKVSTGTLYHYFKGKKESIYIQIFEQMSRQDVLQAVSELEPDSSIEQRILTLFQFMQQNEGHFQDLMRLGFDFQRHQNRISPESPEDASKGTAEILKKTVSYYRKAIEEHVLEQHTQEEDTGLGELLLSFLLGMLVQRSFDPENVSVEKHQLFMQNLAQSLLEGKPPSPLALP